MRPDCANAASVAFLRRSGRDFIVALHAALRAARLYPVEHSAVQRALTELCLQAQVIFSHEQELTVRVAGEFVFVNGTRLRLDLTNYASVNYLLRICRSNGVGLLEVAGEATTREWLVLLSALDASSPLPPEERFEEVASHLKSVGVESVSIGPLTRNDGDSEASQVTRDVANRTYARSVAVTRDVINSVRMGRTPSLRRIKRVVQGIVDQILNDEISLVGLTAIRDYDEYTFTHSVNVCIFSVALGRKLGMTRMQLFDLGLSALMHDIGKSRVPVSYLHKSGGLSEDEWRLIAAHPWLGMLVLFQLRAQHEDVSYRAMTVAYEHHMRADALGYPRTLRPRVLTMTSKIVAVADGYDAATSRRAYQTVPMDPAAVLQEMRDNRQRGMDPTVVKAFINLLGIYPAGTLVVLDTLELAVVAGPGSNSQMLSRPKVRIVSDAQGNMLQPPLDVDLAHTNGNDDYPRTIIKTADPARYGIDVGAYLV